LNPESIGAGSNETSFPEAQAEPKYGVGSVCILSSGRNANDERMYYKIGRSLRKCLASVSIVAPGAWDHRFDDGIEFQKIAERGSRFNRWKTWTALYRAAMARDPDVFQCEELDSWLIGWLVARRKRSKLVFDAHEFNPAEIAAGTPRVLQPLLWALVITLDRFLVHRTDHVFVANDIVRSYYLTLDRFAKVTLLHNSPVLSLFKENVHARKEFLLCHEGSLRFNRGLRRMVTLLDRLRTVGHPARLLIVGDVFGEERDWLERQVSERNLGDCVERTGWLEYHRVGAAVERAEIGIITMDPTPSNMLCGLPNKLFNYMRYGLPVIAPDFPEIERVVRSERCGVIYAAGTMRRCSRPS
jgi:glycosyltransferase involved in cell wall biosynthesis